MVYLEIDDFFEIIFDDIRSIVYDDTQKPSYETEVAGIKKLNSVLELIKNKNYYPTYFKKIAYLFVTLSTGHYFSNGNKRLALFSYIYITNRNGFIFRSIRKKQYIKWFKEYFPKFKLSKYTFHSNIGWALYNFNLAINTKHPQDKNGHIYNFDELKEISEEFFKFISRKRKP